MRLGQAEGGRAGDIDADENGDDSILGGTDWRKGKLKSSRCPDARHRGTQIPFSPHAGRPYRGSPCVPPGLLPSVDDHETRASAEATGTSFHDARASRSGVASGIAMAGEVPGPSHRVTWEGPSRPLAALCGRHAWICGAGLIRGKHASGPAWTALTRLGDAGVSQTPSALPRPRTAGRCVPDFACKSTVYEAAAKIGRDGRRVLKGANRARCDA